MANIEALKTLFKRIPGRVWLAVGSLLVAAFWLQQHDARIRQQAEVQQLRNQTSAEVAALRKQAAQDVKQANVENAKAIAKLEQRRQQMVQQNRTLAAQLAGLREQAQIQAGEVATLPISQIVNRVTTQLGLKSGDIAPALNADIAKKSTFAPAKKTPHLAAGASTRSPRRGPGQTIVADIAKEAIPHGGTPPDSVSRKTQTAGILRGVYPEPLHPVQGRSQAEGERAQDDKRRAQDDGAALALTDSGARKVEAALVNLHACRAENDVETQQISNCQARAEADEAEVKRLNDSVAGLNRAIAAKDKILDWQSSECKAELRAARGTFLGRLARLTEHVAVGVAIGVAIGVAVK
jgi:hypothetical protein